MAAHLHDRYELAEPVEAVPEGRWWSAIDKRSKRPMRVAILDGDDVSDETIERFERTATAGMRLRHPGVERVVLQGKTEEDHPFLVTEWHEGDDLAHRLATDPPMSLQELVRHIASVLNGLDVAHRAHLVHGDIEPGRFILDVRGRPRLTGFGLNRAGMRSAAESADDPDCLRSLRYAAPEQIDGGAPSAAGDVYSVGAVLFRAITGRPPVEGESADEVRASSSRFEIPKLADVRSEVPNAIARAVDTALQQDPKRRHKTIGDLRKALTAASILAPNLATLNVLPGSDPLPKRPTKPSSAPAPAKEGAARSDRTQPLAESELVESRPPPPPMKGEAEEATQPLKLSDLLESKPPPPPPNVIAKSQRKSSERLSLSDVEIANPADAKKPPMRSAPPPPPVPRPKAPPPSAAAKKRAKSSRPPPPSPAALDKARASRPPPSAKAQTSVARMPGPSPGSTALGEKPDKTAFPSREATKKGFPLQEPTTESGAPKGHGAATPPKSTERASSVPPPSGAIAGAMGRTLGEEPPSEERSRVTPKPIRAGSVAGEAREAESADGEGSRDASPAEEKPAAAAGAAADSRREQASEEAAAGETARASSERAIEEAGGLPRPPFGDLAEATADHDDEPEEGAATAVPALASAKAKTAGPLESRQLYMAASLGVLGLGILMLLLGGGRLLYNLMSGEETADVRPEATEPAAGDEPPSTTAGAANAPSGAQAGGSSEPQGEVASAEEPEEPQAPEAEEELAEEDDELAEEDEELAEEDDELTEEDDEQETIAEAEGAEEEAAEEATPSAAERRAAARRRARARAARRARRRAQSRMAMRPSRPSLARDPGF